MTAVAAIQKQSITIERANAAAPILYTAGWESIGIYAGTKIHVGDKVRTFESDTSLAVSGTLVPGYDYGVGIHDDGRPFVTVVTQANPLDAGYFAGFHFAPSGCAEGKEGGDGVAAINPHSIWDIDFRPACPDPRGMALVETAGAKAFWADIYLLGVDHRHSTSRFGVTIADGRDLPERSEGKGKHGELDYATAVEICAHHGKRLLTAEEFFAAAYGVKERCSRDEEPIKTGSLGDGAARFISMFGIFDATGTMWQWGTDGHPDDPRPSIFGGSWVNGSDAGSRYAILDYWAESSDEDFGARAASDHLTPA